MDIPTRLKEWREGDGLSYRDVGDILGCTGNAVRQWEVNGGKPKNKLVLAKLIRCLNEYERKGER